MKLRPRTVQWAQGQCPAGTELCPLKAKPQCLSWAFSHAYPSPPGLLLPNHTSEGPETHPQSLRPKRVHLAISSIQAAACCLLLHNSQPPGRASVREVCLTSEGRTTECVKDPPGSGRCGPCPTLLSEDMGSWVPALAQEGHTVTRGQRSAHHTGQRCSRPKF